MLAHRHHILYEDKKKGIIDLKFLLYWLRTQDLKSLAITATVPGLNRDTLVALQVPVLVI
jgi:restriction endonuclease S subunit